MDKRYSQLELFSQEQSPVAAVAKPAGSSFLLQVNRYEKAIFLLIGFIVTGVSFYCLGVERGKSLAQRRMNAGFDMARTSGQAVRQKTEAVKPAAVVPAPVTRTPVPAQRKPEPLQVIAPQPQETACEKKGQFTIQVGTYQARTSAEREKNKLTRKGLAPVIVKKGGYTIVCVGNFDTKETARSLLSKLRQNYRDCYIRRL